LYGFGSLEEEASTSLEEIAEIRSKVQKADDERLEEAVEKVGDSFERFDIKSSEFKEELDRMRQDEPTPAKATDDSGTLLRNPLPPPRAVVLWDHQNYIPLGRILADGKVITLLTPVVVPLDDNAGSEDPFGHLGCALGAMHSKIRHVPYTKSSGITSTHVPFILMANVVIFVVSGPPADGGNQMELAEAARSISGSRPFILVSCFNIRPYHPSEEAFPTLIQIPGYASSDLEAAATILFSEERPY
jgi:Asp-tRNA(Asn)/Glu-tRNA(Gln) amidotransferase C subunit